MDHAKHVSQKVKQATVKPFESQGLLVEFLRDPSGTRTRDHAGHCDQAKSGKRIGMRTQQCGTQPFVRTQTATDLESFYRSLQTVVIPEEASPSNFEFERIAQLFQKTNQFNLTTRRYQKPELVDALARKSELWVCRARDVHSDQGIIAVALLQFKRTSARWTVFS